MKRIGEAEKERIEAARELWLERGGRYYGEIEREMKRRGWRFSKKVLYTKTDRGETRVGWPDRFGWHEDLTIEQRATLERWRLRRRGRERRTLNPGDGFDAWLREQQTAGGMSWEAPYLRYVTERLARVTSGEVKRLMIFMPPRHGKSELVTIRYVAWRIICEARLNVIIGSYNQRLANRFSRRIRRLVDEYSTAECGVEPSSRPPRSLTDASPSGPQPALLAASPPVTTGGSDRARALAEWESPGGGVIRAVGVGGGIAGFGAGLVVIDDPVRSRADAESERRREAIDDWFKNDIYTRLEPGAAIILIQTRWHEDDLAGRLLKEMADGGEQWEVVRLPALSEPPAVTAGLNAADTVPVIPDSPDAGATPPLNGGGSDGDPLGRAPGEPLCPERYGVEQLKAARRKLGSYAFEALYQQNPSPAEGGQFKRAWFKKIIDHLPAGLRWKRGYDLAVSTSTAADYTASFRVAMDRQGNLYIADGFRAKIEYPEQRRYIEARMRSEPDTEHGIEAALHGKAVVQDLRRDPSLRRYPLRAVPVAGDKLTRALTWLNLAEEGKVFLVRGAWVDEFVEEIAAFPTGRHDDQIDAVSTAVNMLTIGRGRGGYGF